MDGEMSARADAWLPLLYLLTVHIISIYIFKNITRLRAHSSGKYGYCRHCLLYSWWNLYRRWGILWRTDSYFWLTTMISILPHIVRLLAAKVEFIYIDIIPPILNRPPSFSPIRLDIKAICFFSRQASHHWKDKTTKCNSIFFLYSKPYN